MPGRFSEFIGFLLSYPFGLLFAAGSILRNSRIFHPRGILCCGELEVSPESPIKFPAHAMIRFSGGWWKHHEWPDVLGITLRLSERPVRSVSPLKDDQDLLFASFQRPWEIFLAPFMTEYRDFLENSYYAISPFRTSEGKLIDLMLEPSRGHRAGGSRNEKLLGEAISGKVVLRILMKERNKKTWTMVARVRLLDELNLDQEALAFHPFQCGKDLRPAGFLHYLRYGTYHMSQWVRPRVSSEIGNRALAE